MLWYAANQISQQELTPQNCAERTSELWIRPEDLSNPPWFSYSVICTNICLSQFVYQVRYYMTHQTCRFRQWSFPNRQSAWHWALHQIWFQYSISLWKLKSWSVLFKPCSIQRRREELRFVVEWSWTCASTRLLDNAKQDSYAAALYSSDAPGLTLWSIVGYRPKERRGEDGKKRDWTEQPRQTHIRISVSISAEQLSSSAAVIPPLQPLLLQVTHTQCSERSRRVRTGWLR